MLYTSTTQVAAIVSYEVTGASTQVTVAYQGQTSASATVALADSAPGLFTSGSTGQGQARAVNQKWVHQQFVISRPVKGKARLREWTASLQLRCCPLRCFG
jgi:uncharacterized protein (TIGR03437 family)